MKTSIQFTATLSVLACLSACNNSSNHAGAPVPATPPSIADIKSALSFIPAAGPALTPSQMLALRDLNREVLAQNVGSILLARSKRHEFPRRRP